MNESDYYMGHPADCAECRGTVGMDPDGLGQMKTPTPADRLDNIRDARGKKYGNVRINHASIGSIWGGILLQAMSSGRWQVGEALPPELVTLMMVGVKMSREAFRHDGDNIDDAHNYLDFTEELS